MIVTNKHERRRKIMVLFNQTVTSVPADTTLNFNPEETLKRLKEGPGSSVTIFDENGFRKNPSEIEQEIIIENLRLQEKIQKKVQELKQQIKELLKDMKLSDIEKVLLRDYLMGTCPSIFRGFVENFVDDKILNDLMEKTAKLRDEIKNLEKTMKANSEQYPDIWHGPHRLDDNAKPEPLPWVGGDVQWEPYKN